LIIVKLDIITSGIKCKDFLYVNCIQKSFVQHTDVDVMHCVRLESPMSVKHVFAAKWDCNGQVCPL